MPIDRGAIYSVRTYTNKLFLIISCHLMENREASKKRYIVLRFYNSTLVCAKMAICLRRRVIENGGLLCKNEDISKRHLENS